MNTLLYCCMLFAHGFAADSLYTATIPLSGSAYNHAGGETKVYFLATHTGRLQVQVRGRSGQAVPVLVKLDGVASRDTTIRLPASGGEFLIDAGSFEIGSAGYHFISLKPVAGGHLPEISDMVLSGPAAEGVLYNKSQYKGAPATHLTYTIPGDSAAEWFYSEVSVPQEADHSPNAYYETNGFDGGYMGIQLNSAKERRVIFSVWSNYKTNDPREIPADYAVRLIRKGKGVFTGDFGNEGSGGHSHLVFMWKAGVTYKLLVRAKAAGDHTIYTGWFCGPETGGWRLIAEWDKARTGGKLLSHLYSFVENFGDNGEDYFTARYGNQWICTPAGNWIELTEARFSTTADKVKHPRFDYGAGVVTGAVRGAGEHGEVRGDHGEGQNAVGGGDHGKVRNAVGEADHGKVRNAVGEADHGKVRAGHGEVQEWFYMYSGGFRQVNNLAPGQTIRRMAVGVPPAIDIAALPGE